MKKLLLLLVVVLSSAATHAQLTCGNAVNITTNNTFVVPTITGTYPSGAGLCFGTAAASPKAIWYKYTPAASGLITVDAGIPANPTSGASAVDSRLSIFSGTCVSYTCIAANDDINEPGADYRSRVTNISVTAGTTYYIVWDNRWKNTGFSFTFTFTAATCFKPTDYAFVAGNPPTTTTAAIEWDAPTQGTPIGYEFEYGVTGFTQGTGTTVPVITPSVSLSGLSPNTVYDFYVRTKCSAVNYSIWDGPISFNTVFNPASTPYNTSFEEANFEFVGWTTEEPVGYTGESWQIFEGGVGSQHVQDGANTTLIFANLPAQGVTDSWLFSRGLNLTAGSTVTVNFYRKNFLAVGSTGSSSYELKAGTSQNIVGMTIPVGSESVSDLTYTQKTYTFSPATSGVYYLGFHATSPANAGDNALFVDNVSVSSVLGVDDFSSSQFFVFPNPTNGTLTISNNVGASINGIEVVDLNGRVVKRVNVVPGTDISINISDLSQGVYMIDIASDKGSVIKKIVKN